MLGPSGPACAISVLWRLLWGQLHPMAWWGHRSIQPTACQMLFTCHLIYREERHGGGGEHRRPPGANRPCDHQLCNLGKLPNLSDLQLPLHKTEVHTTSVSGVLLK